MDAAGLERLRSWGREIVETLAPSVIWRQEGDELRAGGLKLGLSINTRNGAWYAHALGRGHVSAVELIAVLKECSQAEAQEWADAWLQSHLGTGSITLDDDADNIQDAPYAAELLERLADPLDTVVETYLGARGIDTAALPAIVKFLPNARCGEGAIAGLLTANGRLVGLQIGYLDARGNKSMVAPQQRRFNLESAPGAVFEIPAPAGEPDVAIDPLVTEGLEDALSLRAAGRRCRIVGLRGIGALKHLSVKKGERVVVFRDGDRA